MIDTVIFDLDGTLLDTLDDLTDSVNFALRQMGCPERTKEEIRMAVGNSVDYLIEKALPEAHTEQDHARCKAIYEEHYRGNMQNKTAPYAGVDAMLRALSEVGMKMAVVSNKSDAFTKTLVAELFGEHIKTAVGQTYDRARKPAPDGVLYALELLGADRENAVYVGDSEVDALTAKNAGLPCVGCLWGFRDRETLKNAGVTVMIESPTELLSAIQTL
ncbi:MAG: HAD family hydrolase [Clostridia bacterium]|nr:HAD family hydrolase [Clostridia bacterium]